MRPRDEPHLRSDLAVTVVTSRLGLRIHLSDPAPPAHPSLTSLQSVATPLVHPPLARIPADPCVVMMSLGASLWLRDSVPHSRASSLSDCARNGVIMVNPGAACGARGTGEFGVNGGAGGADPGCGQGSCWGGDRIVDLVRRSPCGMHRRFHVVVGANRVAVRGGPGLLLRGREGGLISQEEFWARVGANSRVIGGGGSGRKWGICVEYVGCTARICLGLIYQGMLGVDPWAVPKFQNLVKSFRWHFYISKLFLSGKFWMHLMLVVQYLSWRADSFFFLWGGGSQGACILLKCILVACILVSQITARLAGAYFGGSPGADPPAPLEPPPCFTG